MLPGKDSSSLFHAPAATSAAAARTTAVGVATTTSSVVATILCYNITNPCKPQYVVTTTSVVNTTAEVEADVDQKQHTGYRKAAHTHIAV